MTEIDENDLKIATGRRLKLCRQLIGLSRNEMAKSITLSPRQLKKFEEGRIKSLVNYNKLFALYTQYGLNSTFLFSGKGSIFTSRGPLTPETVYWLANFVFTTDVDIDQLIQLIDILKDPETRKDIFTPMMKVKLNINAYLTHKRSA
jgi:transcriptional regulator with XRE-family HTH domain